MRCECGEAMSANLIREIGQALDDRGLYLEDAPDDDFGSEAEKVRAIADHMMAVHEWRHIRAEERS